MDDDQVLLNGLRAGDERAFEMLVARYDGGLRRVARTFLRTPSAVDDVVQETWLGVLRGLQTFEGRSSLRTWIFSILLNQARNRSEQYNHTLIGLSIILLFAPAYLPLIAYGLGCLMALAVLSVVLFVNVQDEKVPIEIT